MRAPASGFAATGIGPAPRPSGCRPTATRQQMHQPGSKRDHVRRTSVVRTVRPGSHGAVRWAKRHGDALVCVRYRHDALRIYRFTTVEIVVAAAPIHPRRFDRATFGVRLGPGDAVLHNRLKAEGARWEPATGLWWTRGVVIRRLDLVHRIASI